MKDNVILYTITTNLIFCTNSKTHGIEYFKVIIFEDDINLSVKVSNTL